MILKLLLLQGAQQFILSLCNCEKLLFDADAAGFCLSLLLCNGNGWHRLSRCLISAMFLFFAGSFQCVKPQQQAGCLGHGSNIPPWAGPAQHLGRSSWEHGGLLGLCTMGYQGTRISPKPCWVSPGVSQAAVLLPETVTREVREVTISNGLSCKNVCTSACSGACLQL